MTNQLQTGEIGVSFFANYFFYYCAIFWFYFAFISARNPQWVSEIKTWSVLFPAFSGLLLTFYVTYDSGADSNPLWAMLYFFVGFFPGFLLLITFVVEKIANRVVAGSGRWVHACGFLVWVVVTVRILAKLFV